MMTESTQTDKTIKLSKPTQSLYWNTTATTNRFRSSAGAAFKLSSKELFFVVRKGVDVSLSFGTIQLNMYRALHMKAEATEIFGGGRFDADLFGQLLQCAVI